MYKKLLESSNIEWMAIFPLVLFVVFFVAIVVVALKRKQSHIDKMANLPFEEDENPNQSVVDESVN